MNENQKNNAGMTAGIIACLLAVLGILFLGTIFIPIAFVVTAIGSFIAIKHKSISGIGVNILALVLTVVGFFTSPLLIALVYTASALPPGAEQSQTESVENSSSSANLLGSDMDFSESAMKKRELEGKITNLEFRAELSEKEIVKSIEKMAAAEERIASEETSPLSKEIAKNEVAMHKKVIASSKLNIEEFNKEISLIQSQLASIQ